jgi:glycosyltransferase involved in cell wall biosynthesis
LFVGGFRHAPNVDAAAFLAREVMPHVWRQRGDARLTLVGEHPPSDVRALAGPRVEVTGWVEDLEPVLAGARVAVAPLRFAAGVQIKAIEAMANGVPVVTTSLAAAGVMAADGVHLLVADEPEAIAARICALLDDDALWRRLSDAGRALISERYAPEVVTPRIRALLPVQPAFQPSR